MCNNNYSQKAQELFCKGCNCAQAIVLAFKDKLDVDELTLKKVSSSFGGGVARLREVCGCVSGMAIVMGLIHGDYDVLDNNQISLKVSYAIGNNWLEAK